MIYIDDDKIPYNKIYNFNSTGYHKIEIKFYDNLNMDFMFKDIIYINKIEIISINNSKIFSIISTFENCINLKEFNISGFDYTNLKSMKKLFYNAGISQNISFSSYDFINLQDISYMFAYIPIKEFEFNEINTEKIIDMPHLFEECLSLTNTDLKLNTKNVKDISYMFNSCTNKWQINLNNIDINQVIKMSNIFQKCLL